MGADIFLCPPPCNSFKMHAEIVKALIILTTKSLLNSQRQTSGSQSSETQAISHKHGFSTQLLCNGHRYSVLHSGEQWGFWGVLILQCSGS